MALPDVIEFNGKQISIQEFMLMPCQTKEDLHKWIKLFLGIDLPNCIVSRGSNCSPMDMVWWLYKKNVIDRDQIKSRAIFVASRTSYKTLGMSISELSAALHGNRDVCHIGAIKTQATRCYDYFTKYLHNPIFKTLLVNEPTISRTQFVSGRQVEIIPCTLAQVNGPHSSYVVLDEIETVQDFEAYRDISGIPGPTTDGRPPVIAGISSLKSAFGIMQKEIDTAHITNTHVFKWNVIDITTKCPDERSGTMQIPIYVYADTLEAISKAEWEKKLPGEQTKFVHYVGYEGCLARCKIFPACLGDLKNQTCESNCLRTIDYTQDLILSSPLDYSISQLLSRKPATEGLIYPRYNYSDHVKSYTQMYEIFMGDPAKKEITFDDLRAEFEKRGIYPIMGVDFGNTAVALLIYIDGKDNIYICKERIFLDGDDAELSLWLWTNWGLTYNIQMVYPDIAAPGGIRILQKQGFTCSGKVDKEVIPGIGTVRGFLRIPGTNKPRLFIHDSCSGLIYEIPRYHKKQLPSGQYSEDPEKSADHSCDSLRYPLHTLYGHFTGFTAAWGDKGASTLIDKGNKHLRAPTAAEIAGQVGAQVTDIETVKTGPIDISGDKPEEAPKDPKSGSGSGFSWSF